MAPLLSWPFQYQVERRYVKYRNKKLAAVNDNKPKKETAMSPLRNTSGRGLSVSVRNTDDVVFIVRESNRSTSGYFEGSREFCGPSRPCHWGSGGSICATGTKTYSTFYDRRLSGSVEDSASPLVDSCISSVLPRLDSAFQAAHGLQDSWSCCICRCAKQAKRANGRIWSVSCRFASVECCSVPDGNS